jgi:hypothetical protein
MWGVAWAAAAGSILLARRAEAARRVADAVHEPR